MSQSDIPGYTYGAAAVPRSPVGLQELELPRATLLLGDDDLAALRRFGRWILDTARAGYDQAWLDDQHAIGLRHTRRRAVLLPVILRSRPCVRDGDF